MFSLILYQLDKKLYKKSFIYKNVFFDSLSIIIDLKIFTLKPLN